MKSKRSITKLAGLFFASLMVVGLGVGLSENKVDRAQAAAGDAASGNWTKITSKSDIDTTKDYLLGYENGGKTYYANGSISSSALRTGTFDNAKTVNFVAKTGGYWIQINSTKYLKNGSSTSISDATSTQTPSIWTVNDDLLLINTSNGNRFLGAATASDSAGLKAYAQTNLSSYPRVYIYKKDSGQASALSSISVESSDHRTFIVGDTFVGETIKATYENGTSKTVTASYSGYDMSTTGTQTVNVSYTEGGTTKTTSYSISVKEIVSIAVTTAPNKTTYDDGDTFDSTGMVVTATYNDGTSQNVTSSCEFSPNILTEDVTEVTISYSGKTTTQSVTVNPIPKFALIKSTDDLVAGSKYIFVSGTSGSVKTTGAYTGGNNIPGTDVTIKNDVVRLTDAINILTLDGSATSGWTFQVAKNDQYKDFYLYAASSSKNYLKARQSDSDGNSKWSISFSGDAASIEANGENSNKYLRYNANDSLFSCYGSATGQSNLYLFKEVNTEPTFAVSPSSLTLHLYGESKEADLVTENINNPAFEIDSYSEENIVSAEISDGKISVSPLSEGTTTITIKETTKNLTDTLTVTVDRIPASFEFTSESIELESNGSARNKSGLITIKDANGDTISLSDCNVTWTTDTDDEHLKNTDGQLKGLIAGQYIVTVSIEVPDSEPLTGTLNVNVIDDYPVANANNTFEGSLSKTTYDAGDALDLTGITGITSKTHFGTKTFTDLSMFTYTTSSEGVGKSSDYHFGADDVSTNVTIYAFYEDTMIASLSGITVNAKEVHLENISFKEGEDADVVRGGELVLTPVFYPENTTDARTVTWSLEQDSTGINLENGRITIDADAVVGNAGLITATSTVNKEITAEFMVTVIREKQSVHTVRSEEEKWTKVTSNPTDWSGEYLIGYETTVNNVATSLLWTGVDAGKCRLDSKIINNTVEKVKGAASVLIEQMEGGYSVKVLDGDNKGKYISGTSGSNKLNFGDSPSLNTLSFVTGSNETHVTLVSNTSTFTYNATAGDNNERFRYYKDGGAQSPIQMYKKSGGTVERDISVSDDLFDAVVTAESYFTCSSTGLSFNEEYSWSDISGLFTSFTGDDLEILKYGVSVDEYDRFGVKTNLGNEVEHFLSRYDYIVGKYGTSVYADFLERNPQRVVTDPLFKIYLDSLTDSSSGIVIVSIISISTISGYFLLRKKRLSK